MADDDSLTLNLGRSSTSALIAELTMVRGENERLRAVQAELVVACRHGIARCECEEGHLTLITNRYVPCPRCAPMRAALAHANQR